MQNSWPALYMYIQKKKKKKKKKKEGSHQNMILAVSANLERKIDETHVKKNLKKKKKNK